MHKFTIFTIIFSIMVILVMADLVINDYLGRDLSQETIADTSTVAMETPVLPIEATPDSESRGDEEGAVILVEDTTPDAIFDKAEEPTLPTPSTSSQGMITSELVASFDLLEPRVETSVYDGLLYGFWQMTDDFLEFTVLEHNIFDGTNFVATVYEVQGENEIQAFAAYEAFRQLASTSSLGTFNENNQYGDASFYFNHSTKMNTVYLVTRKGPGVYAFQYGHEVHHPFVRPLIEAL